MLENHALTARSAKKVRYFPRLTLKGFFRKCQKISARRETDSVSSDHLRRFSPRLYGKRIQASINFLATGVGVAGFAIGCLDLRASAIRERRAGGGAGVSTTRINS
jgi:hypothetical protein